MSFDAAGIQITQELTTEDTKVHKGNQRTYSFVFLCVLCGGLHAFGLAQ
jgi:hypothetical protein